MGPAPIPDVLRQPTALEWERYCYEASVVNGITLPGDISGLVGIRHWRLQPGMYIASVHRELRYSSSVIWADKAPTAESRGGIYAYLPPAVSYLSREPVIMGGVIGIVELTGQVAIHRDGTLRGERCRTLMFIARPEFASRLSQVYGVPAMVVSCDSEAQARITSWLCSREGVMVLKRNVDLVSDMQTERLLRQVDGLKDDSQDAVLADDTPEHLRDKGEEIRDRPEVKQSCLDCFILIVRNTSLAKASPARWKIFTSTYACMSDGTISVLQAKSPASLNAPLAELLASGLSRDEDYVLVEPMCLRCSIVDPKVRGKPEKTRLNTGWLKNEIAWLNANVGGRFYWRESVREEERTLEPQSQTKHV